jgi:hypothetical protein
MGGIYEVRRSDELSCLDIHTKFHKDWFRHSEVDKGGIHRLTAWGQLFCTGVKLGFSHLAKNMWVSESWVLGRMFGPKEEGACGRMKNTAQ